MSKNVKFGTMKKRRSMDERTEAEMEEDKDIELLESEREDNYDTDEEKGDCGD